MLRSKQEESKVIGFFYYVLQNVLEACQKLLSPLLKTYTLSIFDVSHEKLHSTAGEQGRRSNKRAV